MRPKLEKTALTQSTRSQKSHKASSRSWVSRSKLQALSCQGTTKACNLQLNTATYQKRTQKKTFESKPQFCLHFSLSPWDVISKPVHALFMAEPLPLFSALLGHAALVAFRQPSPGNSAKLRQLWHALWADDRFVDFLSTPKQRSWKKTT